jgi:hypothetical protein
MVYLLRRKDTTLFSNRQKRICFLLIVSLRSDAISYRCNMSKSAFQ